MPNRSGFTLIEFLVSIVILMVGLLGLLQAVNLSYSHNMQNQIRNEAVAVVDEEMAKEIAKGYDNASTTTKAYPVRRNVLTALKNYSVVRSGASLQNSKQINFEVRWRYKGAAYNHGASTVLTKNN
ncbi:prepilin-type N-terminal cleavage/methylation domain-containing protein [Pelotalea chapellei]|nr:prepilin-type N-terminal cleavage/methylation domain-containing protein [Pelotalea chapellei]